METFLQSNRGGFEMNHYEIKKLIEYFKRKKDFVSRAWLETLKAMQKKYYTNEKGVNYNE